MRFLELPQKIEKINFNISRRLSEGARPDFRDARAQPHAAAQAAEAGGDSADFIVPLLQNDFGADATRVFMFNVCR